MSIQGKRHWKEIDALYAIGIILVLIGHSHSSSANLDGTVYQKCMHWIYTFHMPLFYFISGFLFENSSLLREKGYKSWISDKALRLLTPYLFWSLIAAVPKYWVENRTFSGVDQVILDVFIKPRASVWGHFWFIPVLFLCYAIFGAVKNFISGKMTVFGCVVLTAIIYFLPIKTPILGLADLHTSMFFFAIGMAANSLLCLKKLTIPAWGRILWIITATIGCALITSLAYRNAVVAMISALFMISVCWITATMIRGKLVDWISSYNYTMYIFSWFFQAVMMALCDRSGLGWIPTFFLMFTAGAVGPAVVVLIYDKYKFLHKRGVRLVLGMRG